MDVRNDHRYEPHIAPPRPVTDIMDVEISVTERHKGRLRRSRGEANQGLRDCLRHWCTSSGYRRLEVDRLSFKTLFDNSPCVNQAPNEQGGSHCRYLGSATSEMDIDAQHGRITVYETKM